MPFFNPKYKQYEQNARHTGSGGESTSKNKSNLQQSYPGNPIKADPRWTGFASYAPHISLALLVVIFIDLVLSGLLIEKRSKLYAINFVFGASSDLEFTIPKDK